MTNHPTTVASGALLLTFALSGCGGDDHRTITRSTQPAAVATVPSSAPGGPGRHASGSFAGSDVVTKFGDVQVSITVRRGRIVDVQYLKLPFDRARSASISQQAAPLLRQEVLAAQTAHIDSLSGATYTSDAWASSVAAAIGKAR